MTNEVSGDIRLSFFKFIIQVNYFNKPHQSLLEHSEVQT